MNDKSWSSWIARLAEGDDQAVHDFWDTYGDRLQKLAAHHLASGLQQRVGPEDVVQSACRTFLRRAQLQQFSLNDTESLWRLLCVITITKVREQARFHLRQRRGVQREVPLPPGDDDSQHLRREWISNEHSPEAAAEFADEFEKLLNALDEEEQQFVRLKLEEQTNAEIAASLACSERTVRRILKRVQSRLRQMLE
ncbi:MAG: hypothetical protein CMJ81_15880 [Planctomycetaceae bacterium]|nr:hypothetical protein [Planctomycetaceae bacterium]MBP62319.1 hypothetical protein [Planctomycetaceae bacterium]